jgi:flagellar M-ring protein FliF
VAGFDVTKVRRQAASAFDGFTRGQKTVLVVAVVAALVGGYMMMKWANTPSYAPLYTGLTADDAAAVTQELDAQGVPYELADGGSTVKVPKDQVYQVRIDLSAQGLPAVGNPGYELLDEQGITTSEFNQRVDYQRALEGELSNTINVIDGVQDATVHLVIPAEDLFTEDDTHPSASVMLTVEPGQGISGGQVQAIVHLVASSVEGLTSDQVTVTDSSGRLLASPGSDGFDGAAAGDLRIEQTEAFEQALAEDIESLLVPVTGAGNVAVRVSADLDFTERSTVEERFPGATEATLAPVVVDESNMTETYSGTGEAATGVLGPDGTPISVADGDTSTYDRTGYDRTYAVDKITEQYRTAPGAVKGLNVAVLINDSVTFDQAAVEDLVAKTAGLQLYGAEATDVLSVQAMAFDTSAASAAEEHAAAAQSAESKEALFGLVRTVVTLLVVLVVLFLAYRSAKKSSKRVSTPIPAAIGPAEQIATEANVAQLLAAAEAAKALNSGEPDERAQAIEDLGDLIDHQPDEVAKVLRTWLADRRS